MHRFPLQSWLNYNPLLPARGKWSTPLNSPHHTGQENIWFVECSTTARAMPASVESEAYSRCQRVSRLVKRGQGEEVDGSNAECWH